MADLAAVARTLRRMEQRQMQSVVRVETHAKITGEFDYDTGQQQFSTTQHYEGPASVGTQDNMAYHVEAGSAQVGVATYRVIIDTDADDIPKGATVIVLESPDPALTGRELTVFEVQLTERKVNRVLLCREMRSEGT